MINAFQIIGFSAGVPTYSRGTSCFMISLSKFDIMIDCGEGTFLRWKKADYNWKRLRYIFITHMHPDHIGGLLPFLFYRKLHSIEQPITLIGPPELKNYIINASIISGSSKYEDCKWIDISNINLIELCDGVSITALEMKHKIPCWGYKIYDGKKSIVFITDTLPCLNAVKLAKNVDVLIHEATYDHKMYKKAKKHYHTTNFQAMEIADSAQVKRLILTHFSPYLSKKELKKWVWNSQLCVVFDEQQKI